MKVPNLSLSFSQVAWAISLGQEPNKVLPEQLNYLRQLGIPFEKAQTGLGRGNRVAYGFDELIETALAIRGIRFGMKPAEMANFILENRKHLRKLYRQALAEQPDGALKAEWVKSRGRAGALLSNEVFLRLHDKYSSSPGKFEYEQIADPKVDALQAIFDPVEIVGGEPRKLFSLTRLVLETVAWALDAPEYRTGPKG